VVTKLSGPTRTFNYYIDVKDESGNVANWALEGYPPNTLRGRVFARLAEARGHGERDRLGFPRWLQARASRELTLPDGHKIFTGPPAQ